jgi:hypothetical protein
MILFRILNIRKTIQDTRNEAQNPAGFVGGEIKKALWVHGLLLGVFWLGVVFFLYLLGFTDMLVEPSAVARFFFYFGLIISFFVFLWILIILYFLKKMKNMFRSFTSGTTIQVNKDVVVEDDNHMIS